MDTLEHKTVAAGHPSVSVMPDNNLITLSDTIFTKSWQRGMPHDVSRVRCLLPARPLNRMMLMDLSEDLIAGLLSGNTYVPPRRSIDVPWLFLLELYDEGRNISVMAVVE